MKNALRLPDKVDVIGALNTTDFLQSGAGFLLQELFSAGFTTRTSKGELQSGLSYNDLVRYVNKGRWFSPLPSDQTTLRKVGSGRLKVMVFAHFRCETEYQRALLLNPLTPKPPPRTGQQMIGPYLEQMIREATSVPDCPVFEIASSEVLLDAAATARLRDAVSFGFSKEAQDAPCAVRDVAMGHLRRELHERDVDPEDADKYVEHLGSFLASQRTEIWGVDVKCAAAFLATLPSLERFTTVIPELLARDALEISDVVVELCKVVPSAGQGPFVAGAYMHGIKGAGSPTGLRRSHPGFCSTGTVVRSKAEMTAIRGGKEERVGVAVKSLRAADLARPDTRVTFHKVGERGAALSSSINTKSFGFRMSIGDVEIMEGAVEDWVLEDEKPWETRVRSSIGEVLVHTTAGNLNTTPIAPGVPPRYSPPPVVDKLAGKIEFAPFKDGRIRIMVISHRAGATDAGWFNAHNWRALSSDLARSIGADLDALSRTRCPHIEYIDVVLRPVSKGLTKTEKAAEYRAPPSAEELAGFWTRFDAMVDSAPDDVRWIAMVQSTTISKAFGLETNYNEHYLLHSSTGRPVTAVNTVHATTLFWSARPAWIERFLGQAALCVASALEPATAEGLARLASDKAVQDVKAFLIRVEELINTAAAMRMTRNADPIHCLRSNPLTVKTGKNLIVTINLPGDINRPARKIEGVCVQEGGPSGKGIFRQGTQLHLYFTIALAQVVALQRVDLPVPWADGVRDADKKDKVDKDGFLIASMANGEIPFKRVIVFNEEDQPYLLSLLEDSIEENGNVWRSPLHMETPISRTAASQSGGQAGVSFGSSAAGPSAQAGSDRFKASADADLGASAAATGSSSWSSGKRKAGDCEDADLVDIKDAHFVGPEADPARKEKRTGATTSAAGRKTSVDGLVSTHFPSGSSAAMAPEKGKGIDRRAKRDPQRSITDWASTSGGPKEQKEETMAETFERRAMAYVERVRASGWRCPGCKRFALGTASQVIVDHGVEQGCFDPEVD